MPPKEVRIPVRVSVNMSAEDVARELAKGGTKGVERVAEHFEQKLEQAAAEGISKGVKKGTRRAAAETAPDYATVFTKAAQKLKMTGEGAEKNLNKMFTAAARFRREIQALGTEGFESDAYTWVNNYIGQMKKLHATVKAFHVEEARAKAETGAKNLKTAAGRQNRIDKAVKVAAEEMDRLWEENSMGIVKMRNELKKAADVAMQAQQTTARTTDTAARGAASTAEEAERTVDRATQKLTKLQQRFKKRAGPGAHQMTVEGKATGIGMVQTGKDQYAIVQAEKDKLKVIEKIAGKYPTAKSATEKYAKAQHEAGKAAEVSAEKFDKMARELLGLATTEAKAATATEKTTKKRKKDDTDIVVSTSHRVKVTKKAAADEASAWEKAINRRRRAMEKLVNALLAGEEGTKATSTRTAMKGQVSDLKGDLNLLAKAHGKTADDVKRAWNRMKEYYNKLAIEAGNALSKVGREQDAAKIAAMNYSVSAGGGGRQKKNLDEVKAVIGAQNKELATQLALMVEIGRTTGWTRKQMEKEAGGALAKYISALETAKSMGPKGRKEWRPEEAAKITDEIEKAKAHQASLNRESVLSQTINKSIMETLKDQSIEFRLQMGLIEKRKHGEAKLSDAEIKRRQHALTEEYYKQNAALEEQARNLGVSKQVLVAVVDQYKKMVTLRPLGLLPDNVGKEDLFRTVKKINDTYDVALNKEALVTSKRNRSAIEHRSAVKKISEEFRDQLEEAMRIGQQLKLNAADMAKVTRGFRKLPKGMAIEMGGDGPLQRLNRYKDLYDGVLLRIERQRKAGKITDEEAIARSNRVSQGFMRRIVSLEAEGKAIGLNRKELNKFAAAYNKIELKKPPPPPKTLTAGEKVLQRLKEETEEFDRQLNKIARISHEKNRSAEQDARARAAASKAFKLQLDDLWEQGKAAGLTRLEMNRIGREYRKLEKAPMVGKQQTLDDPMRRRFKGMQTDYGDEMTEIAKWRKQGAASERDLAKWARETTEAYLRRINILEIEAAQLGVSEKLVREIRKEWDRVEKTSGKLPMSDADKNIIAKLKDAREEYKAMNAEIVRGMELKGKSARWEETKRRQANNALDTWIKRLKVEADENQASLTVRRMLTQEYLKLNRIRGKSSEDGVLKRTASVVKRLEDMRRKAAERLNARINSMTESQARNRRRANEMVHNNRVKQAIAELKAKKLVTKEDREALRMLERMLVTRAKADPLTKQQKSARMLRIELERINDAHEIRMGRLRHQRATGDITGAQFKEESTKAQERRQEALRLAIERLGKEGKLTAKDMARLQNELRTVERQTEKAGKAAAKAVGPFQRLKQQFTDTDKRSRLLGRGLRWLRFRLGFMLAGGFSIYRLVAAFRALTEEMQEFESQMKQVDTLLPIAKHRIEDLGDVVQQLSLRMAKKPSDIAQGLYYVVSAGFRDAADAAYVLEAATKFAAAGLASTEETVDSLTSVLNAYGKEASEAGHIANLFFKTVEKGKLRPADLAKDIGITLSTAAGAKVAIEELLAVYAALTAQGIRSSEAAISLERLTTALVSPKKGMQDALDKYGIDYGAAAVEAHGLLGIMEQIRDAAGGNADVLHEIFDAARIRRAGFPAVQNYEKFLEVLNSIIDSEGAVDKALGDANEALRAQWDIIKNQMIATWDGWGTKILEIRNNLGQLLVDMDDMRISAARMLDEEVLRKYGETFLQVLKEIDAETEISDFFESMAKKARAVHGPFDWIFGADEGLTEPMRDLARDALTIRSDVYTDRPAAAEHLRQLHEGGKGFLEELRDEVRSTGNVVLQERQRLNQQMIENPPMAGNIHAGPRMRQAFEDANAANVLAIERFEQWQAFLNEVWIGHQRLLPPELREKPDGGDGGDGGGGGKVDPDAGKQPPDWAPIAMKTEVVYKGAVMSLEEFLSLVNGLVQAYNDAEVAFAKDASDENAKVLRDAEQALALMKNQEYADVLTGEAFRVFFENLAGQKGAELQAMEKQLDDLRKTEETSPIWERVQNDIADAETEAARLREELVNINAILADDDNANAVKAWQEYLRDAAADSEALKKNFQLRWQDDLMTIDFDAEKERLENRKKALQELRELEKDMNKADETERKNRYDDWKKIGDAIKQAAGGVLDMLQGMDKMSSDTRKILNGVLKIGDAFLEVAHIREQMKIDDSAVGFAAIAGPIAAAVAGVLSSVGALLGNPDEERKEAADQLRELIRIKDEITKLRDDMSRTASPQDVSGFMDMIMRVPRQGLYGEGPLGGRGFKTYDVSQLQGSMWEDFISFMEKNLGTMWKNIVEDGKIVSAEWTEIWGALREIEADFFAKTIQGNLQRAQYAFQLVGDAALTASQKIEMLIAEIGKTSPELATYLKDMFKKDPTKFTELLKDWGKLLAAGGPDLDALLTKFDLSAQDFKAVLDALLAQDSKRASRSTQIGRSITEIQAVEVIAWLEDIALTLHEIRDIMAVKYAMKEMGAKAQWAAQQTLAQTANGSTAQTVNIAKTYNLTMGDVSVGVEPDEETFWWMWHRMGEEFIRSGRWPGGDGSPFIRS